MTQHRDRWLEYPGSPTERIRWDIGFQRGFPASLLTDIALSFEVIATRLRTLPTLISISLRIQGPLPNDWLRCFAGLINLRELRIVIDRTEVTWEMIEPLTVLARLQTFLITRNDTTANLITATMRRRFNTIREQKQETVEDEPARLAALRIRIGKTLFTTISGLDQIRIDQTPKQELKLACNLTTLRTVDLGQLHTDVHRRALAELTMIRSLRISDCPAELPQSLSKLTELREVRISFQDRIHEAAIGDWLIALPKLEVVDFTLKQRPGSILWFKIAKCRSLRVLKMDNFAITTDELAQTDLPELLELNCQIQASESIE